MPADDLPRGASAPAPDFTSVLTKFQVRAISRALLTTMLPDGTLEDRADLVHGLSKEDFPRVLLTVLELSEEMLSRAVDSPSELESSLQDICVTDEEADWEG